MVTPEDIWRHEHQTSGDIDREAFEESRTPRAGSRSIAGRVTPRRRNGMRQCKVTTWGFTYRIMYC